MLKFRFTLLFLLAAVFSFSVGTKVLYAQTSNPLSPLAPSPTPTESPEPTPKPALTEETQETLGPLEELLGEQDLGPVWPTNPVKYAIRSAVEAGVPINTIVLLLLLPVVAAVIATTRHLIGIRGFGIFLPAALSVVFISTGPVVGILLFMVIVFSSSVARLVIRRGLSIGLGLRLQYLPKMALTLWFVVLGVLGILFAAPLVKGINLADVSIFPVLIMVLLAEDFSKVQSGKSVKTALNLTTETLILALLSFFFLTLESLHRFALLSPEILLISVALFDFVIGRYAGLRFIELWRFRRLISG